MITQADLPKDDAPRSLTDRERLDVLLDEVCRLRAENARLTRENAILTNAAFAEIIGAATEL